MIFETRKKNRELLASEMGTFISPPGSRESFALLYPNTYNVGMSNLGLHIIYRQANLRGDTACERFFLPDDKKDELLSIENQRKLADFPVIGVMMSFEPDYFNFLAMLELANIPLMANDRSAKHPIIVMGGPCATFNPEPLAHFVDAFIIGEGEETVDRMLDVLYVNKGLLRGEKLKAIAQVPGIYVPAFYTPVCNEGGKIVGMEHEQDVPAKICRQWVRDIDEFAGYYQIITPNTEFSNMFALEVARGCGRHCRFCMAGYCFRPPRARNIEKLWQDILHRPEQSKKVGLMGAAVCDYPEINELIKHLVDNEIVFSLSSLRADMLDSGLVQALKQNRQRTLTIAPEAGSERLRKVINKGITQEDILRSVRLAAEAGMQNIRLYFMIGLPTECMEDIAELEQLVFLAKEALNNKRGRITLSINPFVPKPFTPFQWERMIDEKIFKQRIDYLRKAFKNEKNIDMKVESYKSSLVQSALSCGGRNTGLRLLEAYKTGGLKEFARMLKNTENMPDYKPTDYLPWEYLDMGFGKDYLLLERERALAERITQMCFAGCTRCGIGRKDEDGK